MADELDVDAAAPPWEQEAAPAQAELPPWEAAPAKEAETPPWEEPKKLESSQAGTFARRAASGAITAVGALPAMAAGAELGGAAGAALGSVVPGPGTAVGGVAGSIIGGGAGALLGAAAVDSAKNWLLEKMGLRKGEGFFSEAQEKADIEQNPKTALAGELTGNLAAFSPGSAATKITQRLAGGAVMGGMQAGTELVETGKVDPTDVGMAAVAGLLMPNVRKGVQGWMEVGSTGARKAINAVRPGRPDTAPAADGGTQTPEERVADKTANDASAVEPNVSRGVAQEKAPPHVKDDQIGDPQNKVTRSSRDGLKPREAASEGSKVNTEGLIPDDVQDALRSSLGLSDIRQEPTVKPRDNGPPYNLGLVEAAEAAKPKAPAPEPTPTEPKPGGQSEVRKARRKEQPPEEEEMIQPRDEGDFGEAAVKEQERAGVKPEYDEAGEAGLTHDEVADRAATQVIDEAIRQGKLAPTDRQRGVASARKEILSQLERERPRANPEQETIDAARGVRLAREGVEAKRTEAQTGEAFKGLKGEAEAPARRAEVPTDNEALAASKMTRELREKAIGERKAAQAGEAFKKLPPKAQRAVEASKILEQNKARPAREAPPSARKEPVTAPVTEAPKIVRDAITRLEATGKPEHAQVAEHIKGLTGEEQIAAAAKAGASLTNKTGKVASELKVKRIRNPEVKQALQIGDTGKEAGTVAEAKKKTNNLNAIKKALEDNPHVSGETPEATRARVQKTYDEAKAAAGGEPWFRMQEPPAELSWAQQAKKFLNKSLKHEQFVADEALIRGGKESHNDFRQNKKTEGSIARSRRSGEEAVAKAEAESFKATKETPITNREELEAATQPAKEPTKLEDMTDAQKTALAKDTAVIEQNLIKMFETTDAAAKAAKEAEAAKTPEERARSAEAESLVKPKAGPAEPVKATEGKHLALDPEALAWAKESMARAEAKAKSAAAPRPIDVKPEKVPGIRDLADRFKESATRFGEDVEGSLNVTKVVQTYRALAKPIRVGMEKYFGVPLTDVARKMDAVLAQQMANISKLTAEKIELLDARWHLWKAGATKGDVYTYLKTLETTDTKDAIDRLITQGHSRAAAEDIAKQNFIDNLIVKGMPAEKAKWMGDEMLFHRETMEKIFEDDLKYGSDAEYRKNYVTHIFTDKKVNGMTPDEFIAGRIKSLGPTWYQKERMFDLIEQAERMGFKLKHDNPIDIISARWGASINANMLVGALRRLNDLGLAYPVKDAPPSVKHGWNVPKFNAPDHQQWMIHPEGQQIFNNATSAASLVNNTTVWGSAYRAWMKIKTVWMPIELSLSAFHELHIVANINPAQNLARAIKLSLHDGDWAKNLKDAAVWSFKDPLFTLPLDKIGKGYGKILDDWTGNRFSKNEGRQGMAEWKMPEDQMSPEQKMWSRLRKEGGFSPVQTAEDVIGAKRQLAEARLDKNYPKMVWEGTRRAVEKAQEPMFKYQIPALKDLAYKRNVAAALKMDPELIDNAAKRSVVLREIAKNIDDRYGEMFYKGLFWNRYLKDSAIASMLSLSWNLGQVRQAYGATKNVFSRPTEPMAKAIHNATDKGTFVSTYIAMSMATAGALSFAMSGKMPTNMDWFFPRSGQTNPDGTVGRLTTPFNTREGAMLMGHAEEAGGGPIGYLKGAMHLLYNKMIIQPLVEMAQNKDFYGRQMYDTEAPWYKQAAQMVDSVIGAHLNPISLSGAERAKQQGGGKLGQALAYAGFGPGPKYVSQTALDNRITELARQFGVETKPYEYGEKTGLGRGLVQGGIRSLAGDKLQSEARLEGRANLAEANRAGDQAAANEARRALATGAAGMSKTAVKKLNPKEEVLYRYSQLPAQVQKSLLERMDAEDFSRLVVKNHLMSKEKKAPLIKARTNP